MKKWLVFLLCLTMTGCTKHIKWTYPPVTKPPVKVESKTSLVVAILPFEDVRGYRHKDYSPLMFLPCIPYVRMHYDRPEMMQAYLSTATYTSEPYLDLAKAAAYELNKSGLFKEVFFTEGKGTKKADLILTGEIKSTYFRGTTYPYCIGIFGALFWYLAAPGYGVKNELIFDITLRSQMTKKKVWNYSIKKEWGHLGGLYYNIGEDVDGYSLMMQEGMQEAIQDLDSKIQKGEGF